MMLKKYGIALAFLTFFCQSAFANFNELMASSYCKDISDINFNKYCKKTFQCLFKSTSADINACLTDTPPSPLFTECNNEPNDSDIEKYCKKTINYATQINICNQMPDTAAIDTCTVPHLTSCLSESVKETKSTCLKIISAKGSKSTSNVLIQATQTSYTSNALAKKASYETSFNTLKTSNANAINAASAQAANIRAEATTKSSSAKTAGKAATDTALNVYIETQYGSITDAKLSSMGALIPTWLPDLESAISIDVVRLKSKIDSTSQSMAFSFSFKNGLSLSPIYDTTTTFCTQLQLNTNIQCNNSGLCAPPPALCSKPGLIPYGKYAPSNNPTSDIALSLTISSSGVVGSCTDLLAARLAGSTNNISPPNSYTSDWDSSIPYNIGSLPIPTFQSWQNGVKILSATSANGFYIYNCGGYYLAVKPAAKKAYLWRL